jgi:hypothetical protein
LPSRKTIQFAGAGIALAVLALACSVMTEGLLVKLPTEACAPAPGERVGVIHIHTKASDGGGTVADVMQAARDANLSFVAITDHNVSMTDSEMAEDPPDLPIISGEELSTSAGHFLALGLPTAWAQPKSRNDRDLLAATGAAGAFRVLAHPMHPRTPWRDWNTSDFDGIEVWNEDSVWRRNNPFDLMISLAMFGVNDQLAMIRLARTPDSSFAKWDQLESQRKVVGVCADAHSRISLGFGPAPHFPTYSSSLRIAREHVLLPGDASHASGDDILDALRNGHSYCALDALYPANAFSFAVSSGSKSSGPGDSLVLAGSGHLTVSVPPGASLPLIEVFRNGKEFGRTEGWSFDQTITETGRYRTEVFLRQPGWSGWRRWTLWAFTNPVYVVNP